MGKRDGDIAGVSEAESSDAVEGRKPGIVKHRAFVVDDEPAVARLVVRNLERSGRFEAESATSPTDALAKLQANPADVIISDLTMPEMSGLDFIRALRRFEEHTPVILLTGTPSLETAQRAVELGAFRYLTKPCARDELVGAARHAAFSHRIARLKRQAFDVTQNIGFELQKCLSRPR